MSDLHQVYLNLGSNIEPEKNIPAAIKLLSETAELKRVSSVWETESVGYRGPNFLNVCVLTTSLLSSDDFKQRIIRPIETQMGRIRGEEKNVPRPIDIDIVLFDQTPHNTQTWDHAFIVVPLAELLPNYQMNGSGERLSDFAKQLQGLVWMRKREDVVISAEVPRHG